MSSKFSRRSTRVQHKPHICISKPPPLPPQPPPWPSTINLVVIWSWLDFFFNGSSINATKTLTGDGTGTYTGTWLDNEGHTCNWTMTASLGNLVPATCDVVAFGMFHPTMTSTGGNVYNGQPWSDSAVVLNHGGGLTGSGSYSVSIP